MPSASASSDPKTRSPFDDLAPAPLVAAPGLSSAAQAAAAAAAPVPKAAPDIPVSPCHRPRSLAAHAGRVGREIRLGGQRVSYELRRARRRSIGFVVAPDGLTVSAPRWVALVEIESALHEKSGWILRKLHEQRERAQRLEAARLQWCDGASIPYLGEAMRLVLDARIRRTVLRVAEHAAPGVPRLALHLGLAGDAQPQQIRDAAGRWLERQARRVFAERIDLYAPRLGVRVRRFALSSAATRWGSASSNGSIRLNRRLVHLRMPVIDYVVVHELAHLIEMNHGPAFWDVVRSVLPDFEAARRELRSEVLPVFE